MLCCYNVLGTGREASNQQQTIQSIKHFVCIIIMFVCCTVSLCCHIYFKTNINISFYMFMKQLLIKKMKLITIYI